jgi:hypothetical protein
MEVLLATSILLACVVVLVELAEIGRRHYVDVDQLTTAQLICQSKLNAIVSGAAPLTSVEEQPVVEAPGWLYSVDLQTQADRNLVVVRVTVAGERSETEDAVARRKKSFSLTRGMHAPGPGNGTIDSDQAALDITADFGSGEGLLP